MANQNFAKTAGFHSAGHKYGEKCDKYLNLAIELQKLWNTRIEIFVPLIFGALGTVHQSTVTALNSFS